ncbi:MAG TPA: hypothetical protein PKC19_16720 [Roseiflexaceae bacterium]|nr:hypothetical protein [Roseiflexaceae bacterium]
MSRNTQLTRRGFLRSTVAAGGGIAAVGFAGILGVETPVTIAWMMCRPS